MDNGYEFFPEDWIRFVSVQSRFECRVFARHHPLDKRGKQCSRAVPEYDRRVMSGIRGANTHDGARSRFVSTVVEMVMHAPRFKRH